MHYAEWLIQRIIFLERTPVVSRPNPIQIGQTVPDMIGHDQEAELAGIEAYNAAIALAHEPRDQASADLLTTILKMAEGHGDWADKERTRIEQMVLEIHIANQTMGAAG